MDVLTHAPVLGHVNTFGGHPVCCTAGKAAFEVLLGDEILSSVKRKEDLFISLLSENNDQFRIRSHGLMIALEFESFEINKRVIDSLLAGPRQRIFTDWFLFAPNCLRIAPPLTISEEEIKIAVQRIKNPD
jgi:acetylornithine/succinyldiaminopimelate/putrescine aminotransferase